MLLIMYVAQYDYYCCRTSPAGTAFLWWTYVDIKSELDREEAIKLPLLDVDINSERAFLVYSIVATVLTVSIGILSVALSFPSV